MNPILWHKVAAVSGMAAFGLGIYGADGFKSKNPAYKEKTFQTLPTFGNLRQLNLDILSYQSKSEEALLTTVKDICSRGLRNYNRDGIRVQKKN